MVPVGRYLRHMGSSVGGQIPGTSRDALFTPCSCSYCKFRDFHSLNVCLLKKYFGCICSMCVCVYVLVCCRARGTSRISTLWSLKH